MVGNMLILASLYFLMKVEMTSSKIILRIPGEWEEHSQTFMVWPASRHVWGEDLPRVRDDIARIAKAIAQYEPVTVIADPTQASAAKNQFTSSEKANISFLEIPVDDLWARDTLPIFGVNEDDPDGGLVGINLNFNGWGNKQRHDKDGKLAKTFLEKYGIPNIDTKIVAEGGSFEFDGNGTLMVTKSSVFNKNRNPEYSSIEELESAFQTLFNVQKVIWFDGVYGQDITDAHVDSLVRFAGPGVVILNKPFPGSPKDKDDWTQQYEKAKVALESATDAKGRSLRVVELTEPDRKKLGDVNDDFLASYVNYLIVNGAVIMPAFGDEEADNNAKDVLQNEFPDRDIVLVRIPFLATGGGGIHCATHDLPLSDISGVKNKASRAGLGF